MLEAPLFDAAVDSDGTLTIRETDASTVAGRQAKAIIDAFLARSRTR